MWNNHHGFAVLYKRFDIMVGKIRRHYKVGIRQSLLHAFNGVSASTTAKTCNAFYLLIFVSVINNFVGVKGLFCFVYNF